MTNNKIETAVSAIQDMVNTYTIDQTEFNKQAAKMHRTLQNSFTKVCLGWMEYVASEEYRCDPRNITGHQVCAELMEAFKQLQQTKGYTDSTLELMCKPSGYCAMV